MPVAWSQVAAPWGPIHVAAAPGGVVALHHLSTAEAFVGAVARDVGDEVRPAGFRSDPAAARLAERAAEQLVEYLAGRRRRFDVPVSLGRRGPWDRDVLNDVSAVPWGAVTSYGHIARRIGRRGAARAVGGAVGRNPIGIIIPCHRVIAGDGSIGGYGGDWLGSREALLEVKRELLRLEGIELPAQHLLD